jgi:HrpA-like RNA helicase
MQLPVVGEEQKIMEAIHKNSTVVVFGATGSGKNTQTVHHRGRETQQETAQTEE